MLDWILFLRVSLATAPLPLYLIASSSTWSGSPTVRLTSDPLLLHHSVLDPRPDILFNITVSAGVLTAVKLFSHSLGAAFSPAFSFLVLGSARQRGDPSIMGRVVYCLVVEGGQGDPRQSTCRRPHLAEGEGVVISTAQD